MHFILTFFTMLLLESSVTYQTGCLRAESKYVLIGRLIEVERKLQLMADTMTNLETRNSEWSIKDNEKQQTIWMLENKTDDLTNLVDGLNSTVLQLSSSVLQLSAENDALKKMISQEEEGYFNESRKGSTYVLWGRSTCPGNGSDVVYKGYIGGAKYNGGNAANHLCLPEDPEWKAYDVNKNTGSKLCGSEYQDGDVDLTAFLGPDRKNKDPVCVVCSTVRPSVLMIPGKTSCNDGWTEEYDGYLVSGKEEFKTSEFICLDDHAEYRNDSESNDNGRLLYLVEAKCGALPCPPYVEGREITCVVCSK